MRPIEVFILDKEMNRLTGSVPYSSLTWERKYYEPGQFEMVVPADLYTTDWAYVYCDDRPETGIIQKVQYDDSSPVAGGRDNITISGFFLEAVLNRLVFLVEQTETEEYYIPKPTKPWTVEPKFCEDADGNIYTWTQSVDGTYTYRNAMTGEYTHDIGEVHEADVQPGAGLVKQRFETNNTQLYPEGYYEKPFVKSSYNYYTGDGKLHEVNAKGEEKEYELISSMYSQNSTNSQVVLYRDDDGNICYTTGVAMSEGGTYLRRVRAWEENTDGLEIRYVEGVGMAAVAYREVKGPWQLRTDIGDVGKEMDNVQQVILWAQVCFGNEFIYDEPGFAGEVKTIDPSLQRVGDLFYAEMQTIGASVRVFYDFYSGSMTFSVWRGLDRTQDQAGDKANPWAVFSDTWGTMYGYSASRDVSNFRNVCYVLYDYYEPQWDEDGNPVVKSTTDLDGTTTYTVPQEHKRGYVTARVDSEESDAETWLDLRNEEPDGADELPDPSNGTTDKPEFENVKKENWDSFFANLEQQGIDKLQNDYPVVTNLDTGTLWTDGYMSAYDLGDLVDMEATPIGLKQTARITAITEVYEASGSGSVTSSLNLTIGEEKISITSRSKLN